MNWEQEIATAFRKIEELVSEGFLTEEQAQRLESVSEKYQFFLPRYYASLIDKSDPMCPIRLQAIPRWEESLSKKEEIADPLQDLQHQPVPRITHRYANRVLLHLTPNCSMYCRFCFRKSLLNELKSDLFSGALTDAFQYLKNQTEIQEVIFSGGDPFMVSEGALQQTLQALSHISHIKRVRFHSRVPVTLPSRVNSTFVDALTSTRFRPIVVTHFNHPKELTHQALEALFRLREKAVLLNQSVLLKDVNDESDVLIHLCERLFEAGVLPYYLHQLDSAQGTSHFFVDEDRGRAIVDEMRKRLPGYLVPRYVIDIVGDSHKREV